MPTQLPTPKIAQRPPRSPVPVPRIAPLPKSPKPPKPPAPRPSPR